MFVFEILRNAVRSLRFDLLGRCAQSLVGFPTFLCAAHVSGGMGQRYPRFRHPHKFHGLLRGYGQWQRFRIGQPHVFAGEDDDAPGNEAEILSGMQHFRQPVHRSLFVRRAHALDKCADGVVMRVALLVVNDGFMLNAFFGNGEGEMNNASGDLWGGNLLPAAVRAPGQGFRCSR